MTITITKAGQLPELEVISVSCRNCGCEFTFNPPDAQRINDQRDGDYYQLPCPTCKRRVTKAV